MFLLLCSNLMGQRGLLHLFYEATMRERLDDERVGITRTKAFGNYKIAQILNYNEKGELKEIQLRMGKTGSLVMEHVVSMSILISKCLQYGVSPESIAKKLEGIVSEPSGFSEGQNFESICQYVAYLLRKFSKKGGN